MTNLWPNSVVPLAIRTLETSFSLNLWYLVELQDLGDDDIALGQSVVQKTRVL